MTSHVQVQPVENDEDAVADDHEEEVDDNEQPDVDVDDTARLNHM